MADNGTDKNDPRTRARERYLAKQTKTTLQVICSDMKTEAGVAHLRKLDTIIEDVNRAMSRGQIPVDRAMEIHDEISQTLKQFGVAIDAFRTMAPRSARNNRGRTRKGGTNTKQSADSSSAPKPEPASKAQVTPAGKPSAEQAGAQKAPVKPNGASKPGMPPSMVGEAEQTGT